MYGDDLDVEEGLDIMEIKSVFGDNEEIPEEYTCDGDNVNPSLEIKHIPDGTESLILIIDDPDAPLRTWAHWVLYNIPVGSSSLKIEKNSVVGKQGYNDFKEQRYGGPCPPSGIHRYFFKVFALDDTLFFDSAPTRNDVLNAMSGHVLDNAELVGLYSKKK